MLIYIIDNVVRDVLPFTKESAVSRLTPEYIEQLIEVDDAVEVGLNYVYENDEFIAPPTPAPRTPKPTTEDLINILLGIEVENE
jgi:hypothetical protein